MQYHDADESTLIIGYYGLAENAFFLCTHPKTNKTLSQSAVLPKHAEKLVLVSGSELKEWTPNWPLSE